MLDPRLQVPQRVQSHAETETVLRSRSGHQFNSNMTIHQHKQFNDLLNQQFGKSRAPGFRGTPIEYKRYKETDYSYPDGTRVTKNEEGRVCVHPCPKIEIRTDATVGDSDHTEEEEGRHGRVDAQCST